jgi:hypothetical protein
MAPRATRGWRMCSRIEQQAPGQILVKRKLNAGKLEPAMALGTETGGCAARLGAVCRKRPLLAFYALTLVISWPFWIPVAVSHQALIPFWPSTLFLIFGSFGPSLSAVILAAMKSGASPCGVLAGYRSGGSAFDGTCWPYSCPPRYASPPSPCMSSSVVRPLNCTVLFRGTRCRSISWWSCSSSAR